MDDHALALAGDANLAITWAMLGRHAGFTIGATESLTFSASGLPLAFFNGVFVHDAPTDPERSVAEAITFFAGLGVPYLVWIRVGAFDELLAAGRAAGLRDAGGPPAMALARIGEIQRPPAQLDVCIARTADDLQAHRDVLSGGFGMPDEIAVHIIGAGLVDDPDVAIAVGRVDGVAVTTALMARSGETAGVYNVATLPDRRAKGYGEAATWAVIGEGARRGCTHSILQSSDAGHAVYRRMGFVDVGRYVQLEGPPH